MHGTTYVIHTQFVHSWTVTNWPGLTSLQINVIVHAVMDTTWTKIQHVQVSCMLFTRPDYILINILARLAQCDGASIMIIEYNFPIYVLHWIEMKVCIIHKWCLFELLTVIIIIIIILILKSISTWGRYYKKHGAVSHIDYIYYRAGQ